jgi:hypothetical protein
LVEFDELVEPAKFEEFDALAEQEHKFATELSKAEFDNKYSPEENKPGNNYVLKNELL